MSTDDKIAVDQFSSETTPMSQVPKVVSVVFQEPDQLTEVTPGMVSCIEGSPVDPAEPAQPTRDAQLLFSTGSVARANSSCASTTVLAALRRTKAVSTPSTEGTGSVHGPNFDYSPQWDERRAERDWHFQLRRWACVAPPFPPADIPHESLPYWGTSPVHALDGTSAYCIRFCPVVSFSDGTREPLNLGVSWLRGYSTVNLLDPPDTVTLRKTVGALIAEQERLRREPIPVLTLNDLDHEWQTVPGPPDMVTQCQRMWLAEGFTTVLPLMPATCLRRGRSKRLTYN